MKFQELEIIQWDWILQQQNKRVPSKTIISGLKNTESKHKQWDSVILKFLDLQHIALWILQWWHLINLQYNFRSLQKSIVLVQMLNFSILDKIKRKLFKKDVIYYRILWLMNGEVKVLVQKKQNGMIYNGKVPLKLFITEPYFCNCFI